jgi:phage tail sheath protein FI
MPETFLHGVEVIELSGGIRPIRTVRSSVIGLVGTAPDADATKFPLDTPVLVVNPTEAAGLDTEGDGLGSLPGALDGIFDQAGAVVVVIRVDEGDDETDALAAVVGGVDGTTGAYKGCKALLGAEQALGVVPRILIAPGFTHQRPSGNANPVVAELAGIAARLRAVVIADGPNTTDATAIAAADASGSARVYLVDPWVKVLDGEGAVISEPPSARIAGIIARVDNDEGFWVSPSNHEIYGIIGTHRPVDFSLGDAASRANLLNEGNVATIIRQNGFRLWGNRSLSSDPQWAFLSVRRTGDMIQDSLLRAHLWAVDRAITKTYVDEVVEGVNAYLRSLTAQGAILGGVCIPNKDLNTPANIAQGKIFFDFDWTPAYPAEHITMRSAINNDRLEEIFG